MGTCCYNRDKGFKLPEDNQIDVNKSQVKEIDIQKPDYNSRTTPFTSINSDIFEE